MPPHGCDSPTRSGRASGSPTSTSADQALILAGWLEGPPADVMARMRSIAAALRADPWRANLPELAAAVEHLLHGLRDLDTTPKE